MRVSGELAMASGTRSLGTEAVHAGARRTGHMEACWGKTQPCLKSSTVQSSTFIHMEDTHMRACMDSLVNGLTISHTSTYVDTLR